MPKGIAKNLKEKARKVREARLKRKQKLGYLNSLETRKKMSETHKRLGTSPPSNKGKKFSKDVRKRMGNAHKGEKNSSWQGGISYEPYSVDWTDDLKRAIRKRDQYTCQICGKEPAIDVHHLDFDKKNCSSENLITLCHSCHAKITWERRIIRFKGRGNQYH